MRLSFSAKSTANYLVLLLLSAIVILPIMPSVVDTSDHKKHYKFAFDSNFDHAASHPLFHVTIRAYRDLLPSASRENILSESVLTYMLPLPLVIFWGLTRPARRQLPDLALMFLALAMMIVAPVTIWVDNVYMLGYLNSTVYHNPTSNILRVFLVPLALSSLMIFERSNQHGPRWRVMVAIMSSSLVVVATLAKPSYTIALLPGLLLYALWRFWQKHAVDLVLLALGFCLPGALVLGGEYFLTYITREDGSSLGFGFLTVLAFYVPLWRIPIQFLLSIAFPVTVYLLYLDKARQHLFLNLTWVIFGVGTMISMLVYEAGRLKAANLVWTSYSVVFVLMFASLQFLVEQDVFERRGEQQRTGLFGSGLSVRFCAAMLTFALHVASGIAYYFRFMYSFSDL